MFDDYALGDKVSYEYYGTRYVGKVVEIDQIKKEVLLELKDFEGHRGIADKFATSNHWYVPMDSDYLKKEKRIFNSLE